MTYSPATVANYFLKKASSEGRAVTPMQLLKLVYIAHGWHLAYFNAPLINEEVQAWKYGPVIHSLYKQLRQYGSGAVGELIPTGPFPWSRDSEVTGDSAALLDHVWDRYAGFSGIQLSAMTHQQDTPWFNAWHNQGGSGQYFAPIHDGDIYQHYKAKVEGNS
jgi:uncharacterized phage-associated protein